MMRGLIDSAQPNGCGRLGPILNTGTNAPMPYFVYYVTQHADSERKTLEYLETLQNFKAARSLAREKRAELKTSNSTSDCRLIFAKNQAEAEKLLSTPRDERVVGED